MAERPVEISPSGQRDTIRLTPSPFRTSGPEVQYEIETWACGCRDWPIVIASKTWNPATEMWKQDYFDVRKCGLCREFPRPKDFL